MLKVTQLVSDGAEFEPVLPDSRAVLVSFHEVAFSFGFISHLGWKHQSLFQHLLFIVYIQLVIKYS